ncbi:MAG TPA: hypothetical protein VF139_08175 [Candidatus Polarisedimenticolaceae bacterium]
MRAAAVLVAACLTASPSFAAKEPPPIEVYQGLVQVINAPAGGGMARFTVRILRWSTDEEKIPLRDALAKGGSEALADAMEKVEPAAYLQIDSNLRHAIRVASTWETEKGRMVRLATDRPILIGEAMRNTRSMDYPIGILEFLVPAEGPGEGILLAACEAGFDAQGRLEVKSLPQSTGPQRLTMVEKQKQKQKKQKKQESE